MAAAARGVFTRWRSTADRPDRGRVGRIADGARDDHGDKGDAGIKIQSSKLEGTAYGLKGADAAKFNEIATLAESKCPVSNAYRARCRSRSKPKSSDTTKKEPQRPRRAPRNPSLRSLRSQGSI